MALTESQIEWLRGAEVGLGPWEVGDASDPAMLEAIVDDIGLVIGIGHAEDVRWVTPALVADYILSCGEGTQRGEEDASRR